jgi:predicted nucleic acid-binding protein
VIHLDTTFLVDLLREARRGPGPATAFLHSAQDEDLWISLHVLCELHAGAELSTNPPREKQAIELACSGLNVVLPGEELPHVYGRLLSTLQRNGQIISTMDLLIAASALLDNAPLMTRNLKHFNRVPGLQVLGY